jgi:hypothetical protein
VAESATRFHVLRLRIRLAFPAICDHSAAEYLLSVIRVVLAAPISSGLAPSTDIGDERETN